MDFKFTTILISLIFIFIIVYEFYFVVIALKWNFDVFILPLIFLIILYLLGYYYYTSNSQMRAMVRGWLFLLYSIIFVFSYIYIFSPGIVAPWPYEISVKEILFRSYIGIVAVIFTVSLYDFLLERKVGEKYDTKYQMIAAVISFTLIFIWVSLEML